MHEFGSGMFCVVHPCEHLEMNEKRDFNMLIRVQKKHVQWKFHLQTHPE